MRGFVQQAPIDVQERLRSMGSGDPYAGEREIALLGVILALIGVVILLAAADKRARMKRDAARRRARAASAASTTPQTVRAESDSFVTFRSATSSGIECENWEFRAHPAGQPLWVLGRHPGGPVLSATSLGPKDGSVLIEFSREGSDVPEEAWLASARAHGGVKLFPVTLVGPRHAGVYVAHAVESEPPLKLSARAMIDVPLRATLYAPDAVARDLAAITTTETTELGFRRAVITASEPLPLVEGLILRCRLPNEATIISFPIRSHRRFDGGHELILEDLPPRERVRLARAVACIDHARGAIASKSPQKEHVR